MRQSIPGEARKGLIPMARKRHSVDQIIPMLRRADIELGQGNKVPEICRLLGIKRQTYYRWRQKCGGIAIRPRRRVLVVRPVCHLLMCS